MATEKITFQGHSGADLAARLDLPEGAPIATAIFAHCFTCGKDIAAARAVSAGLNGAGFAVLRFDFTGLGHSEGEFANTGFTSNVEDLGAAATHLAGRGMSPALLVGHSLGGAAVLAAASRIATVRAVATIGAPADPAHVLHNFGTGLAEIEAAGEAEVSLAGRPFRIGRGFVEDVRAQRLTELVAGLRKPILLLHAPRDETVGIENAGEIFTAAKHPKSFVSLDEADHLLTRRADGAFAAQVIAAWAQRYAVDPDRVPEPSQTSAAAPPEGVVRVVEQDPNGFRQSVRSGPRHRLVADEPASFGGTDQGPGPYDLVSAGLGACTAMTIRMYARRKGWPLAGVSVDVRHDRIYAEDCAACETQEGKIDRFTREITLLGDLSEDQRIRLREIADRCPVHRTLESEIVIDTVLAGGNAG
ncbi:MAG: bifunctional alpha/beta hydrolase/OsmC family protein [Pseudomonadota bacterium]